MIPGAGWAHRPAPPATDHARAAQVAAEDRLEEVLAADACGCVTCLVRETLDAAYPHLRAMWDGEQQ